MKLPVTIALTVEIDVDVWEEAYGQNATDFQIKEYVSEIVREEVSAAFTRRGLAAEVGIEGAST